MANKEQKVSAARAIMNHAMAGEPTQMKAAVGKEIANRVMNSISKKRASVGKKIFG